MKMGKCPECGKDVPNPYLGETKFCSLVCEKNYRYRMKHMDPLTGKKPSPDQVKKI